MFEEDPAEASGSHRFDTGRFLGSDNWTFVILLVPLRNQSDHPFIASSSCSYCHQ